MNTPIKTCAVLGLGKAGKSLLASLSAQSIPAFAIARGWTEIPTVDVLFLAIPDDAITEVAEQISRLSRIPPIVVHISGVQSLSILAPLKNHTAIGQFHPLAVFDGVSPILPNTFVGICSSNEQAAQQLTKLAQKLELSPSDLEDGKQSLYHAAAVILSNHAFVLADDAQRLMIQAGISADASRKALAQLMHSFANALDQKPIPEAMTGPVKRGDVKTIERHTEVLSQDKNNADILKRYQFLMNALVLVKNHN